MGWCPPQDASAESGGSLRVPGGGQRGAEGRREARGEGGREAEAQVTGGLADPRERGGWGGIYSLIESLWAIFIPCQSCGLEILFAESKIFFQTVFLDSVVGLWSCRLTGKRVHEM